MRAILLAVLVVIIITLSNKAEAVERDKLLHFAGSLAITAITYAITDDVKVAVAVGLGAGLAKELYDSRKGRVRPPISEETRQRMKTAAQAEQKAASV